MGVLEIQDFIPSYLETPIMGQVKHKVSVVEPQWLNLQFPACQIGIDSNLTSRKRSQSGSNVGTVEKVPCLLKSVHMLQERSG